MTIMRGNTYQSSLLVNNMSSSFTSTADRQNGSIGTLSRQRESVCATYGLSNPPGDNNCFLNSAVQIFWHLDVFRRNFRRLQEHVCLGNACIFCGVKMLFRQFQHSTLDSTFATDMLRRALASTFHDQQRFQLGCMDDAADCFENILLRIHYHVTGTSEVTSCSDPLCIPHGKFSMNLVESFSCNDCNHTSDPLTFSQLIHYVPVKALYEKSVEMNQRGVKSLTGLFGKLIRKANESGDQRVCRNCNSRNALLKCTLTNHPDIVTIGLNWESEKAKVQIISDVIHAIDTNICLCHLYHGVSDISWASSAVHHLVGMICFYGRHYSAFFYHSPYQTWMYFDDASVKEIGPKWSQVVAKCVKSHIQPMLLFYANSESNTDNLSRNSSSSGSSKLEQHRQQDGMSSSGTMPLKSSRSRLSYLGNSIPATGSHKPQPPPRTVSQPSLPINDDLSATWKKTTTAGDISLPYPDDLNDRIKSRDLPYRTPLRNEGIKPSSTNHQGHHPNSVNSHLRSYLAHSEATSTSRTLTFAQENGNNPNTSNTVLDNTRNCRTNGFSRQSPGSSFTSSSIASLESFDSLDHFRQSYAYSYPLDYRDSVESCSKNETDSGYPSGDHASSSSASSSVEIPFVKRDRLKSAPLSMNLTQYIQMMLRADDLIASACLKEDKADWWGAVKLFEQAGMLLKICTDSLRSCPQLPQAVTVKYTDCCKKLHALRGKITSHGSRSDDFNDQPVCDNAVSRLRSISAIHGDERVSTIGATFPRIDMRRTQVEKKTVTIYQSSRPSQRIKVPGGKPNEHCHSISRSIHKSQRKAGVRNLDSRQTTNRSMPDLSQAGSDENDQNTGHKLTPTSKTGTHLSTFQVMVSDTGVSLRRSVTRDILLTELTEHLHRKHRLKNQESFDECQLPPPPPEMLLSSYSSPPSSTDIADGDDQICSLCGQKPIQFPNIYCSDCHSYISRFNKH